MSFADALFMAWGALAPFFVKRLCRQLEYEAFMICCAELALFVAILDSEAWLGALALLMAWDVARGEHA